MGQPPVSVQPFPLLSRESVTYRRGDLGKSAEELMDGIPKPPRQRAGPESRLLGPTGNSANSVPCAS